MLFNNHFYVAFILYQGCLLIRNMDSFNDEGCVNCGWGEEHITEGASVFDFLTPNYEGSVGNIGDAAAADDGDVVGGRC